jgi:hypothetical protein
MSDVRVYFADDSDLANAGGSVSIEDARALVVAMRDRAQSAADQASAVDERLTAMKNGSAALRERRSRMRNEHEKATVKAFETMVLEYETADHQLNAAASARQVETISWLSAGLTHWDTVTLPKLQLEHLRADAHMLREAGGMTMAQALEAAVLRHDALKHLIDVDGAATITASGKAHDLWVRGLEQYRRAAEYDASADAEERRQKSLERLN